MGIGKDDLKPFTKKELHNKELIIKMLEYEDSIIHGDLGYKIYSDPTMKTLTSLDSQYVIQRIVLMKFGFDTAEESLNTYRDIGRTYYRSPTDYDSDVMKSVTYLRENRLLYYKTHNPQPGEKIPNCNLLTVSGDKIDLYEYIKGLNTDLVMLHAFSTS